jgi:hypothetical protein
MRRNNDKRFALVKWLDGVHEGTFTHNLDLSWILDFDGEPPYPDSVAVEWLQGAKPRHGWHVYNATVMDVSSE